MNRLIDRLKEGSISIVRSIEYSSINRSVGRVTLTVVSEDYWYPGVPIIAVVVVAKSIKQNPFRSQSCCKLMPWDRRVINCVGPCVDHCWLGWLPPPSPHSKKILAVGPATEKCIALGFRTVDPQSILKRGESDIFSNHASGQIVPFFFLNFRPGVRLEVWSDVPPDAQLDVRLDVWPNARPDVDLAGRSSAAPVDRILD